MSARPFEKSEFASLTNTPVGGVTQLNAHFVTHTYDRHSHDTFCLGVTRTGVQAFRCHGVEQASLRGNIMALNPDEPHDGHAGTPEGYSYRMLYVAPAVIRDWMSEAAGRNVPLQYFRHPVISDGHVAAQLERAITA
ncbi:MAG TPA: AraC family ligand binding domain-containing protein, partial [Candidatus Didemnitutus sp.]|nr:AraC family ligand binding domain-containing protein [Candidatus Didemnitutus sp.]